MPNKIVLSSGLLFQYDSKEFRFMAESNVYALTALASFIAALVVAKLWVRLSRGDLPGATFWGFYLRILLGFLLAAAVVFGYRCLQTM